MRDHPRPRAAALRAYNREGQTVEQIAERLGKSKKWVRDVVESL